MLPPNHRVRSAADALHVLVVEDDDDIATTEALVLGIEDHAVTIASDGLAAVHAIREEQPDVVLLDLGLPKMDGIEVARQVRAMGLSKRPLLVALTARDDEESVRRCQAAGIVMHLVKPVPPETLCILLRRFHRTLYGGTDAGSASARGLHTSTDPDTAPGKPGAADNDR